MPVKTSRLVLFKFLIKPSIDHREKNSSHTLAVLLSKPLVVNTLHKTALLFALIRSLSVCSATIMDVRFYTCEYPDTAPECNSIQFK